LGKIEELVVGNDGKTTLAKVKTAHGFLMRPLQRLYPLEIRNPRAHSEFRKETRMQNPKEPEKEEKIFKTNT